MNHTRPSLASLFSWAFVTTVGGLALSSVAYLLVARLLGPVEFGALSYLLSWLSLLSVLGCLGLDSAILRLVPAWRPEGRLAEVRGLLVISSALVVIACALSGVAVLIFGIASNAISEQVLAATVSLAVLPLLGLAAIRQSYARARHNIVEARAPDMMFKPLLWLALIALASQGSMLHLNATLGVATFGIATLASLGLGLILMKRSAGAELCGERRYLALLPLFAIAWPFFMINAVNASSVELDRILSGSLLAGEELGYYSLASRLAVLCAFGAESLGMIAAPLIAEVPAAQRADLLQKLAKKLALLGMAVGIAIILPAFIFAERLVGVFGTEYGPAVSLFRLLLLGTATSYLTGPAGFFLTMTDNGRSLASYLAGWLAVGLLLMCCGWFIGGALGLAAGSSISVIFRNVLFCYLLRKKVGVESSVLALVPRKT